MEKTTGFKLEKFPYNTKNEELKKSIDAVIAVQATSLEARIAALSEYGKELYKKGLTFHEKLTKTITSPDWAELDTTKEYSSYSMKGEGGFICVKSVAVLACTPIEVLAYIKMEQYKQDYDESYIGGKEIEVYPANMRLALWNFKGKLFVSNRDFVLLQHSIFNEDGSINVAVSSVEDPRAPPTDNVRGRILVYTLI